MGWVWDEFQDVAEPSGKPAKQHKCLHCKKTMSKLNGHRVKLHLLNTDVCSFLSSETARKHKSLEVISILSVSNPQPVAASTSGPNKRKITHHFGSVSKPQQQHLLMLFATMMYNTNIPFWWVEQPSVKAFFNALNPGFKLPTRKQLSNQLLLAVYSLLALSVKATIRKAPYVTLLSDGWSRRQGSNHILNFMVSMPKACFFIDLAAANESSCTGEYIKEQITATIDRHGLRGKTVCVLTDTPPVMQKAWRLLEVSSRDDENWVTWRVSQETVINCSLVGDL